MKSKVAFLYISGCVQQQPKKKKEEKKEKKCIHKCKKKKETVSRLYTEIPGIFKHT